MQTNQRVFAPRRAPLIGSTVCYPHEAGFIVAEDAQRRDPALKITRDRGNVGFNQGGNNGTVTIPINGRAAPPTEANFAVLD